MIARSVYFSLFRSRWFFRFFKFEDQFGFEDPTDIFNGFSDAKKRWLDSVDQGKQIVQVLPTGAKHFVTIHFSAHKLTLFDSIGVRLTKKLRDQILQLF